MALTTEANESIMSRLMSGKSRFNTQQKSFLLLETVWTSVRLDQVVLRVASSLESTSYLVSLSLSLFLSLSIYLSLFLSLSIYLSLFLSPSPSLFLFFYLPLSLILSFPHPPSLIQNRDLYFLSLSLTYKTHTKI
jgi:hypothetical protein